MLIVRKSLNCRTPTLLVCTSIKGNTKAPRLHESKLYMAPKAPRLHEPKLHDTMLLVRTSLKGDTPCSLSARA
ncbi:hypothetical protein ACFX13_025191 [Malus domestica]